jgi:pyrroline-5-carboxylate reductase
MAGAMARGWAGADGGPEAMLFCDLEADRAATLAEQTGGEVRPDLASLASESDAVLLAVKPDALEAAASELAGEARAVMSVLAATPLARLAEALPGVPLLRVMPNQPVEVRRGVLCFARGADMPDDLGRELVGLLELLGSAVELGEERMEAAMAVMSCSPAYVAQIAETLAGAGAAEGLDPQESLRLVVETFAGTAELLRVKEPAAVRRAVAPPGGATEAGLDALEREGLGRALNAAVRASLERFR